MKARAILLFLLISMVQWGSEFEEIITREIKIIKRHTLIVECDTGEVNLISHGRDTIHVRANKTANEEDALKNTEIIFQESDHLIKIFRKCLKPDQPVSVVYQLTVPASLQNLQVICLNGRISAKGTFKKIDFTTKTGNILFEGDFSQAEFRSVNGKIDLYIPDKIGGDLTAETENGEIRLELNPESDFSLTATTGNGDIYTNYALQVKEDIHFKTIGGKLNRGIHTVRIKSLNGVIKIYRY